MGEETRKLELWESGRVGRWEKLKHSAREAVLQF